MSVDKKQKIWIKCERELMEFDKKPPILEEHVVTVPYFQECDHWALFLARLEKYFKENNVKSDRQVPVLLTSVSESIYCVLKKLCRPELPNKKTFKQLTSLLSKHFSQKNSWKERIKFFKLKQGQESITEWFDKVKSSAVDCNFGGYLDEHIKNKFISGMRSGPILDRLCDEEITKTSDDLLHIALVKDRGSQEKSEPKKPVDKHVLKVQESRPVRQSPRKFPNPNKENLRPEPYSHQSSSQINRPYQQKIFLHQFWPGTGNQGDGRDEKRGTKRPHDGDDDDDAPAPTCLCGLTAKRLTVRREGPNQGRDFFVCPKDDNKCSLYTWADEVSVSILCFCQLTARKMTVRKDGPNKGRQFFGCPKNHEDPGRCQFFVWAEEAESGNYRGNNNRGGGGGGRGGNRSSFGGSGAGNRSSSGGGTRGHGGKTGPSPAKRPKALPKASSKFRATGGKETPKVRKCGVCGQPGHNRKNCPQMTGD